MSSRRAFSRRSVLRAGLGTASAAVLGSAAATGLRPLGAAAASADLP